MSMNDGAQALAPKSLFNLVGPTRGRADPLAPVAGPTATTIILILKPQSPTRPRVPSFSQAFQTATTALKSQIRVYGPSYVSFDACRTGEPFPRASRGPTVDANRRPAIGCTRTAGILDDRVAMHSFIPTSSRP